MYGTKDEVITDTQSVRTNGIGEGKRAKLTLADVDTETLKHEQFKIYVAGKMEAFLSESMTATELYTLLIDTYDACNKSLGTNYDPPRIKRTNILKRLKRCQTCNGLYFDLTMRNQSTTCDRNVSIDKQGRLLYRNGRILSECHREALNAATRKPREHNSISASRIVRRSVESFANVIDENGDIVRTGRRRTISVAGVDDYGTNGGAITLPFMSAIKGIFTEYFDIKDEQAYQSLDDDVKTAVTPSKVNITYLFERSWSELTDDQRRIYGTETEFNRYKYARLSA